MSSSCSSNFQVAFFFLICYSNICNRLSETNVLEYRVTSRTVLAYKTGFCIFSVYRNQFLMLRSFFFVLKLEVYVCLVKSLLILSFYLSKQLKESSKTQNLGVKRL